KQRPSGPVHVRRYCGRRESDVRAASTRVSRLNTSKRRGTAMSSLFEPFQIRDVLLPNRIGISPMCQYCAQDGMADDWHFVHYGGLSLGGAGLMIVEASAVAPEGRISPYDLGIWETRQIEPLARIACFAKKHGCVPALQLAHAGRKGSKSENYDVKTQRPI